jgi:hypothetical protein
VKLVGKLSKLMADIANDVQPGRTLHSSKLHYLGVVADMKTWCKEFSDRHKMGDRLQK